MKWPYQSELSCDLTTQLKAEDRAQGRSGPSARGFAPAGPKMSSSWSARLPADASSSPRRCPTGRADSALQAPATAHGTLHRTLHRTLHPDPPPQHLPTASPVLSAPTSHDLGRQDAQGSACSYSLCSFLNRCCMCFHFCFSNTFGIKCS